MTAYPSHLVSEWQAPDGTRVTIRPIRAEDADIEVEFVRGLSADAKYLRFMSALRELTPAMLAQFTRIDYNREMALIAVIRENDRDVQVGVARYVADADAASCEFAIVVADRFQGRGLGQHLMLRLIDIAHERGYTVMTGFILSRNVRMLALAETLGFTTEHQTDDPAVTRVRRAV